jgi:hypothetical protein
MVCAVIAKRWARQGAAEAARDDGRAGIAAAAASGDSAAAAAESGQGRPERAGAAGR